MTPLEKAIKHFGSQGKMGAALGIKQANVSSWLRHKGRCPAEWAIPIERASGGHITRYELRPDIYPLREMV